MNKYSAYDICNELLFKQNCISLGLRDTRYGSILFKIQFHTFKPFPQKKALGMFPIIHSIEQTTSS